MSIDLIIKLVASLVIASAGGFITHLVEHSKYLSLQADYERRISQAQTKTNEAEARERDKERESARAAQLAAEQAQKDHEQAESTIALLHSDGDSLRKRLNTATIAAKAGANTIAALDVNRIEASTCRSLLQRFDSLASEGRGLAAEATGLAAEIDGTAERSTTAAETLGTVVRASQGWAQSLKPFE